MNDPRIKALAIAEDLYNFCAEHKIGLMLLVDSTDDRFSVLTVNDAENSGESLLADYIVSRISSKIVADVLH
jgi:hypothetical protein